MLVALVFLPAVVMGVDGNARQLRAFASYATEKVDEGDNYSLRGIVVRYLTPGLEDSSHIRANVADVSMTVVNAIWLVGLGVLGVAGLIAIWRDVDDPIARMLEFSLVMTGIVLASPHTQRRYYVAFWVPAVLLAMLWSRSTDQHDRRRVRMGLLAMGLPASVLPLFFGGHRLALIYEAASPYTIGGLILYAVLVAMTRARKSALAGRTEPAVARTASGNLSAQIGV